MDIEDIKIAKSQEVRATNVVVANGATVQVAGLAANRVTIHMCVSAFAAAIANLNAIVLYTADSTPVGVDMITSGDPRSEFTLDVHSHMVKGPFSILNQSGSAMTIGVIEILQNVDPENVL